MGRYVFGSSSISSHYRKPGTLSKKRSCSISCCLRKASNPPTLLSSGIPSILIFLDNLVHVIAVGDVQKRRHEMAQLLGRWQHRTGPLTLHPLYIDQVVRGAEVSHQFGIDPPVIHKRSSRGSATPGGFNQYHPGHEGFEHPTRSGQYDEAHVPGGNALSQRHAFPAMTEVPGKAPPHALVDSLEYFLSNQSSFYYPEPGRMVENFVQQVRRRFDVRCVQKKVREHDKGPSFTAGGLFQRPARLFRVTMDIFRRKGRNTNCHILCPVPFRTYCTAPIPPVDK